MGTLYGDAKINLIMNYNFFFKRLMACLFLLALLSACAPQATPSLRLYVLECGYMDMVQWSGFESFYGVPKSAVEVPAQANPCFLIINNGKSLLWDAGLSDLTPKEPAMSDLGVEFSMPITLQEQLALLNSPLESLNYFAISHLHFDHVGNWQYFKDTETLLQEAELQGALVSDENNIGYVNDIIEGIAAFKNLTLLQGDHDVFGDGLVTLLSTPGHTAGHQSLIVKLANYGSVIISGDAIHFSEEREHHFYPAFNTSKEESQASLNRLLALEMALKGELWVQHDPIQHAKRKLAPNFYD